MSNCLRYKKERRSQEGASLWETCAAEEGAGQGEGMEVQGAAVEDPGRRVACEHLLFLALWLLGAAGHPTCQPEGAASALSRSEASVREPHYRANCWGSSYRLSLPPK